MRDLGGGGEGVRRRDDDAEGEEGEVEQGDIETGEGAEGGGDSPNTRDELRVRDGGVGGVDEGRVAGVVGRGGRGINLLVKKKKKRLTAED